MTKEFIVSLDIGTSGCRAVAVRADGSVAAQHYVSLTPTRPVAGCSEYEAATLWHTAQTALDTVLAQVGPQQVASLAVTSQRSTVVLWDKQTGQTAGPVLTWEDGRCAQEAQQAPLTQEEVHAKTGLYKTPFFSAPKIAWSLRHLPLAQTWQKQGRLLAAPVASYIIWQLTAGQTFATDYSLAQRTLLLDIHSLTWSSTLCEAFGVSVDILPQLRPSGADYGAYCFQGVSIPIAACVADQQAAACYFHLSPYASLINYGTGAFWLYYTGDKPVFLPGMLTSVGASQHAQTGSYFLEGPVNVAGSALLWLKAQGICFEDKDVDALCHQAQHPVQFLPAFGGLGAPYWDFKVPTVVENLSPHTRQADWVAGVVRAIAFLVADIGRYLQANGLPIQKPVYAAGGLSHLSYLTALQADLLQQPVHVAHQADATALGAAAVAAAYSGLAYQAQPAYTCVPPGMPAPEAQAACEVWAQFVARARTQR